ncbi:MAG: purine-nucleoside phosphorylase [Candidatus Korarchaeum sp.]
MRISKHVLATKPYHILAKPEDISERVLIVGDPGRADLIAKELLKDARLVNSNRGFNTYTGFFEGVRVSVATHGIGGPSAAIVVEELAMLGAKVMVRLGTCGGLTGEVRVGDAVVALGAAHPPGGAVGMYTSGVCYPAVAEPELTLELQRALLEEGFNVRSGLVASSDAFHAEEENLPLWSSLGIIAVEMECATVFTVARLRRVKAGAALLVIDNLATGEFLSASSEERRRLELRAAKGALKALLRS